MKEVVFDLEAKVGGWKDGRAFLWGKHIGADSKQVF